jgi:hypothetical protein
MKILLVANWNDQASAGVLHHPRLILLPDHAFLIGSGCVLCAHFVLIYLG